jgi:ribonuclease P protein component
MNKEHIIKENFSFQRIISNNKSFKYKDYIIYVERTNASDYKFGFSVGKKIGNAVTRNKIKRQLRSIVSKKDYQNGFNCIIIVGSNILNISYQEMEKNLLDALKKLNLLKEKIDE